MRIIKSRKRGRTIKWIMEVEEEEKNGGGG